MAINKNFVIKNGIEVAENLLIADSSTSKVGIGTTDIEYSVDIRGDVAIGGKIYVTPQNSGIGTRTGTLDANTRNYISGIDTTGIKVNDLVYDGIGGVVDSKVISVGISSLEIRPIHSRTSGSITRSITITRRVTSGNVNDILVSRGEDLPPIWKTPESESTRVVSSASSDVHYPTFVTGIGITTPRINENNLAFIPSSGNLGIGSSSPTVKLDVIGNAKISGIVTTSEINVGTSGTAFKASSSTGRVGINSTTPTEKLDVGGNIKVSGTATVGVLSATNARVTGVATVGFLTATDVRVSGSATVGFISATDAYVTNTVTALTYFGDGVNLTGIVTQITAGIGVTLTASQSPGKGVVKIDAYYPIGKTIFVTQNGNDTNSGLTENDSKRTIKAAAAIAFPGDTIKVYPGVYVENNPVYLSKRVSVEGTELRNCIVTPKNLDRDLFYVNNSCHITDISFIGPNMSNGAAVVALQPLAGVATDRFFDAARMIRFNLDYIANEAVGFLTSTQYIGAGRTQTSDPVFTVVDGLSNPVDPSNCSDDIKDIFKAVIHDITRGGNSKCVGAGKSYYDDNGALLHITGTDINGYSVKEATIDTINYAAGIARAIINNVTWGSNPVGVETSVTNALYDNTTGITTITATDHGLSINDAVKIVGLGFTCPSGPGIVTYPSGTYGYIFNVRSVINSNEFEVVVGQSTLPHTYDSGGTVQKFENFQNQYTQVKDVSIQPDPETGFNDAINGCSNVVSAIYSCVGVVTSIIDQGLTVLGSGINTSFPANAGTGTTSVIGITSVIYDNLNGQTTITAPNFSVKVGDIVEIRDLLFECESSGVIGTQRYPSGAYGYEFDVTEVNNNSFVINTGVSTIAHTYVGGGYVVNRAIGVTTASYDNVTGITTITAPGANIKVGDFVKLHDLNFSCTSGAATTTLYPTGNLGYEFLVTDVIGSGTTFVVNVGTSTIPHTYVSGGVVFPPYSPGVGPITQGPYIRNCTNFIGNSIGMKVDGFNAEPGDQDDIGVTGTMSVDSYTQYNQGGIGVSITNGAYSQLVSIFTICDDTAIFTGSGGQCDITNSNSSFGTRGLVSDGVGDYNTKSIYHHTGVARTTALAEQATIEISGLGNLRPYDGQTLHFGELYYEVRSITVTDGGSGYTQPPTVTIDFPTGPNGIRAEASSNIDQFGRVTSIDIISSGNQYRPTDNPQITIAGPGAGTTATASVDLYPLYYTIESATLPNAGISTVVLNTNLNNTVSAGTTVYLNRLSLQITSSHSFEWVGSGNDINLAKPALGGVVVPENEVVKLNGGEVVYTSTDQAGNFKIGDDFVINQLTGTVTGRSFNQSILSTVTPLIIALGN